MKAKEFKTEMITKLADNMTCYLNSDIGKHEILNPPGLKPIRFESTLTFSQEYCNRIDRGVNRWCESVGTLIVMQENKDKINDLLSDVHSMIHDIEEDITGLTKSTHIPSFDVFTRSALHRFVIGTSVNIMELMKQLLFPSTESREQKAEELYQIWVSRCSNDHIRSNLEMIFGTEYDRIVHLIFENEIPRKIKSLKLTIDKLLFELSDNDRTEKSLMELNRLVQDINTKIEDFIVEAKI